MDANNAFLIYQDENGLSNVNVRFEGEDVWLAAEQIQQLFQASRQDVAYHIQQIYADGELTLEATCKKFLQVRPEGERSVKRSFSHYNLEFREYRRREMIQYESDFDRVVRELAEQGELPLDGKGV